MKQLILKGLGKAKVRSILKKWIIEQANLFLDYEERTLTINSYSLIEGYGLPSLGEDDDFRYSDLTEFLNNKI